MLTRRDFLQVATATAALTGLSGHFTKASAKQAITQDDLLKFDAKGQVTLLHMTDCHAQIVPLYFREPSINMGVGAVKGLPPHITGKDFLHKFGIAAGTPEAYAMSSEDFVSLARTYGKVGGFDRMATLVKAVRAERPGKTLFLDGGDTWQGSYTSLKTGAEDMVQLTNALGIDAMTAHWEFTYGEARVKELIKKLNFPFLAGNVFDTEWEERVFEAIKYFERGGVKIAVIGQAFPYTPVANPRYMIPKWSFGIREDQIREYVEEARGEGADLVVLLSHNGFDVDRKLASRVDGIDVILTGHTHDALPVAIQVNSTLLIASGSHGKFLSRLDLDVKGGKVADFSYRIIPVLSDVITPDPEMAALVKGVRAPFEKDIGRVLGKTEDLLYRRGNFNGTFDDLICKALISERDSEFSLSPGFRWGSSLLPGQEITLDHVHHLTSITYPNAYRSEMSGQLIKDILEDVADNLFNVDPYYQQGGDMVRVGGFSYAIDPMKKIGERIYDMRAIKSGEKIEADKNYVVSGWASVNEGTKGPPVYDVVADYITKEKVISLGEIPQIKVRGM